MSPLILDSLGAPAEEQRYGVAHAFPHIQSDPTTLPASLDPFTLTVSTGFMPLHTPQVALPEPFAPLTKLASELPVRKLDGSPGLLAHYQVGPTVDGGALPDLTSNIDNLVTADGSPDLAAVTAAFREYAFIASSYLLEPCWQRWSTSIGKANYGLGRQVLPKCIAGPLVKAARMLDIHPFMSYAAAYSLYNYCFEDSAIGTDQYSNLRLIRAFEHGLDPTSSEAGFVLTHVDMVKHSGGLIQGTVDILNGISSDDDGSRVLEGLETMLDTMQSIEASMERMWSHSRPKDYISYRTFIFGITSQSMFPDGVVYEGHNDNIPLFFRGESGANDSMIPLLDHLLQIPMPENPLTDILKDFRSYRPKPHREFLAFVRRRSEQLSVRDYCCSNLDTTILYLRLLEHVRSFRWRHWLFAREYIIRRTAHPTATGGSPIVTWLPNQLFAVMDLMCEVWNGIPLSDKNSVQPFVVDMMANVETSRTSLKTEVERWCRDRGV